MVRGDRVYLARGEHEDVHVMSSYGTSGRP
jgi:hypothetical protein